MKNSNILAEFAVEHWKLLRAFERTIGRLPCEHAAKAAAQLRFSAGKLESLLKEGGLNLVTFEDQKFEPNMPATAINVDDFDDGELTIIEITIEPAVIQNMTVLHWGKVMLKKLKNDKYKDEDM
jgi:hypothetical protein